MKGELFNNLPDSLPSCTAHIVVKFPLDVITLFRDEKYLPVTSTF